MGHFEAQRSQIVHRMFVATADENYILARLAFQQRFAFDFLWLSLHALEKYFKAIRLLNGMPRMDGHDIASLHAECIVRFPNLIPSKFSFSKDEREYWRKEGVRDFIVRLNSAGSAENRYASYGYALFPDELAKIDFLVWHIRRCCRTFASYSNFRDESHGEQEGIELLRSSGMTWQLSGNLPIERLVAGKRDEDIQRRFLQNNKPWGADTWIGEQAKWSSANSPFAELISFAQGSTSETSAISKEVLQWARANIYFSPQAGRELDQAVAAQPSPMTP
ncbi:hypothetical protein [Rhizobium leguminosarum]